MIMRFYRSLTACYLVLWIACFCTAVQPHPFVYHDLDEEFNPSIIPFFGDNRIEEHMIALNQVRNRMKHERKRTAAMGVDLPDYILHYKGRWPNLSSFRDRMLKSGRR
ncbi:uncharacterized protein LOC111088313 [Limulus polyphemus]|uniref:Uncharacterized protein LOC111088313 n=1 Tax=Limulus polyphemus TaxID=6850 RepID=A0ABM1TD07_LIMPO|nr:uncharacterized protein LOC111088313 [Limulus polyphemus]